MLGKVIIENEQKKIQALTADTGTGAPVGSYLYLEKKSNPQGYLYCDGSTFDETVYPALYQYLGTNVLPDWREFSAVGAEQNTTSSVIATHDVFTQGQEKDDCLQDHYHSASAGSYVLTGGSSPHYASGNNGGSDSATGRIYETSSLRKGTVTRGKSRAVFIYIKATSGLTENQQENVLNTINENNSYSTEEHPTGAKWIDGKPIYRKTIVYENQVVQANGDIVINHGIANIDHIIKADILPHYSLGEETVMLQWNLIDNKWVTATKLQLHNNYSADITFTTLEIFIEYTKTTD